MAKRMVTFVRYCIQSVRSLFFGRDTAVLVKRRGGAGGGGRGEDKVIRVCRRKYLKFVSIVVFSIDFCRKPSDFAVA